MRKIITATGVLTASLIVLTVMFLLTISPEKKHYTSISQRTLSYVTEQKDRGNPQWLPVDFAKRKTQDKQILGTANIRIPGCFSFDPPYALRSGNKTGECTYKYYFDSPHGYMTISVVPGAEAELKDISAVIFRRLDPETYREKSLQVRQNTYLLFKKMGDTYEQTVFRMSGAKLFTMSFVVSTNENLDKKFLDVIKSIDFLY